MRILPHHEFSPVPYEFAVTPESIARAKADSERERELALAQVPELRDLLRVNHRLAEDWKRP